jgi:hypothetical protein
LNPSASVLRFSKLKATIQVSSGRKRIDAPSLLRRIDQLVVEDLRSLTGMSGPQSTKRRRDRAVTRDHLIPSHRELNLAKAIEIPFVYQCDLHLPTESLQIIQPFTTSTHLDPPRHPD